MYGENFSRCKVHSIAKNVLTCLHYEDFFHIVQNTVGGFLNGVDKQNARIQYRDDENTFVTMKDESDLKDALTCLSPVPNTDGVFRLCVRVHDDVTPVTKPLRSILNKRAEDGEIFNPINVVDNPDDQCGKTRKRRLDFELSQNAMSNRVNVEAMTQGKHDSDKALSVPTVLHDKKILTPIERYIARTERGIEEKDERIQEIKMEEENIRRRIETAKSNNVGNGTFCRNCHMRLGHNARNCTFDKCSSIYQCGEDKFHPGEVNLKQMAQTSKKLKNDREKLTAELKSRKSAAENINESILNRLENSLLEADPSSYHVHGVKNWSLLRHHVFALRKYCETTLRGRIPPKHEVLNCLKTALTSNSCAGTYASLKQSKRRRENPAKSILEGHGIQFPTQQTFDDSDEEVFLETYDRVGSRSSEAVFENRNDRSHSWIHRIEPVDKNEEIEQLELALSASYAAVNRIDQSNDNVQFKSPHSSQRAPSEACSSTCTASSSALTDFSLTSVDTSSTSTTAASTPTAGASTSAAATSTSTAPINEAATTLMSLRNCYINTNNEVLDEFF